MSSISATGLSSISQSEPFITKECLKSKAKWVADKVWLVAKVVLFVGFTAGAIMLNEVVFPIGLVLGIVYRDEISRVVTDITQTIKGNSDASKLKRSAIIVGLVLICFFTLATSANIACFLWAGYAGTVFRDLNNPVPQSKPTASPTIHIVC